MRIKTPFQTPLLMQKVALARCVVFLHLKVALFHKNEMMRLLSGNLVFLLMEGSTDTRKMIESILPKGVFYCHAAKVKAGSRSGLVRFPALFLLFLPSFLLPSRNRLSYQSLRSLFLLFSTRGALTPAGSSSAQGRLLPRNQSQSWFWAGASLCPLSSSSFFFCFFPLFCFLYFPFLQRF
jgi:hypothetical protein